jgi:tRNA pseudouridine55 synthase
MLSGLLIVNKPINKTSHDIVAEIRKCLKIKKVGHFGTLDPFAEGLLLIAVGKATKFFDFYLNKKKKYSGIIKFGYSTTTYDSEGERSSEIKEADLYSIDLESIVSGFIGKQMQLPPLYSAKKYKGKPMYKYARADKEVVRKPSEIEIYSFDYKIIDKESMEFEITVSSGTYIRSIAFDFGEKTGFGAYLAKLIREVVGEFNIENAISYGLLRSCKQDEIEKNIILLNKLLPELSKIIVNGRAETGVLNGREVSGVDIMEIELSDNENIYKILNKDGKLLALSKKDILLSVYRPFLVFN